MQVRVVAMEQGTLTIKCTTAAASWLKDYMQNAHTDGLDSEDVLTAGMRKEFLMLWRKCWGQARTIPKPPIQPFSKIPRTKDPR